MDTLRDLVKEQGIVNIIMDYVNNDKNINKYKNILNKYMDKDEINYLEELYDCYFMGLARMTRIELMYKRIGRKNIILLINDINKYFNTTYKTRYVRTNDLCESLMFFGRHTIFIEDFNHSI